MLWFSLPRILLSSVNSSVPLSNFPFSLVPKFSSTCHLYVLMLLEIQHLSLQTQYPFLPPHCSQRYPHSFGPKICRKGFSKPHHPFYFPMPVSDQVLFLFFFSHSLSALSLPVYFSAYHFHPWGLRLHFPLLLTPDIPEHIVPSHISCPLYMLSSLPWMCSSYLPLTHA